MPLDSDLAIHSIYIWVATICQDTKDRVMNETLTLPLKDLMFWWVAMFNMVSLLSPTHLSHTQDAGLYTTETNA